MKAISSSWGIAGLVALGMGCSVDEATTENAGNAALGIARFDIDDTSKATSVIGLDANGHEVARLELVHGRFAVTDRYRDDFPGLDEAEGRKLEVSLGGALHMGYAVSGFDPVLHLPAHPPSEHELALFLADPHVKPVLDRWQLGWDSAPQGSDPAYVADVYGSTVGTAPFDCSSPATSCGSTARGAMNTCNGGVAILAQRVTTSTEYKITQYCPAGTGNQSTDWFAVKACSIDPNATACVFSGTTNNGVMTTCGCQSASSGCRACPSYPVSAGSAASMSYSSGQTNWCYAETPNMKSLSIVMGDTGQISTNIPASTYTGYALPCTTGTCTTNTCNGASITLTKSDNNWDFTGFTGGGCTGTGTSCTVSMTAATSVTANYKLGASVSGGLRWPAAGAYPRTQGPTGYISTVAGQYWNLSMNDQTSGYTYTVLSGTACTDYFSTTGSQSSNYVLICQNNAASTGIIRVTHTASGATRDFYINNF